MITAYGDAETRRQALEGGAEALLTKPIDFATLRHEIEARLEGAAERDDLGRELSAELWRDLNPAEVPP